MRKKMKLIGIAGIMMLMIFGCGKEKEPEEPTEVSYADILPKEPEPVIVRDKESTAIEESTEETETAAEAETQIVPFADRIAGENAVSYNIESAVYEDGAVSVEYPQLTGMENGEIQQQINESIKSSVTGNIFTENISSYELKYETATKGSGMVSFIFRGMAYYENAAYPNNIIKTLNINLNTGESVRLKDFSDIAEVVSCLELADGYFVANDGVDMADFSAFLNNGAVTDYAMTLLDYDIDFQNPDLIPAGFSAVRDNHLVLFIEAEHAMGDYVELEFYKNL